MQQINDGSSKRRTLLLANKIGAILSTACSAASTVRSRNMPFGFSVAAADDFDDGAFKKKTHPSDEITSRIALPCQRPIAVASAVLTRKWKASLRKVARVKLRLKAKTKTTTANDDAVELCKKRILMGEKCRALNLSGVLHYDKQGILLPED